MTADPYTAALVVAAAGALILAALAKWWLDRDKQRWRRGVMQHLARARNHRKGRT